MRRFLRENGLSVVWLGLFFLTLIFGQSVVGHREYNSDQREHGRPEATFAEYVTSAHFVEATMENWESEFLQMFLFIVLTAFLYQKGSAESKKLDEEEAVDRDPRRSKHKKDAPWPVRKGGLVLRVYENSLSLAFLLLFLVSFFLHAAGGARVQPGAGRARLGRARHDPAIHRDLALLVRVFTELAERIPVGRPDGGSHHLAAAEGLARIEARRRPSRPDAQGLRALAR